MTIITRIAVVGYMLFLTVGLLAGQWPLQGPQLVGSDNHGVHAGDVVVLLATASASIAVLKPRSYRFPSKQNTSP